MGIDPRTRQPVALWHGPEKEVMTLIPLGREGGKLYFYLFGDDEVLVVRPGGKPRRVPARSDGYGTLYQTNQVRDGRLLVYKPTTATMTPKIPDVDGRPVFVKTDDHDPPRYQIAAWHLEKDELTVLAHVDGWWVPGFRSAQARVTCEWTDDDEPPQARTAKDTQARHYVQTKTLKVLSKQ